MSEEKRSNLIIAFFILLGGFFAVVLLFQGFNFVGNRNATPIFGSVVPTSIPQNLVNLYSSLNNLIFYKMIATQPYLVNYSSGIIPSINVSSAYYGIVNSDLGGAGLAFGNTVMKDGSIYRMWWCSLNVYNYSNMTLPAFLIYYSNSSDGINWSPKQVAINYTQFTYATNYTQLNCFPSAVKVNNTYYLYYTGIGMNLSSLSITGSIFAATSSDGIKWSTNVQPVFTQPAISASNIQALAPLGIIYINNQFMMYYENTSYSNATFLATSNDGFTFTQQNNGQPVMITPTSPIGDTKYLSDLNLYFKLFGGSDSCNVYWSYSQDGINWLPFDSARNIQASTCALAPSILSNPNGTANLQTSTYYTAATNSTPDCTVAGSCGIGLSYLNISAANLVQSFNATDFACAAISSGFNCRLNYTSTLNESVVVTFLFTDSNGNVVTNVVPIANSGTSQVSALYFCSNSASLNVAWKAYRQSDSSLANAIAWSKSYEQQTINC